MDLTAAMMEFFFHPNQGVLGIDGLPHPAPQTIHHEPALGGIPTIDFEPAGIEGLNKLFSRPLISGSGATYFETVACSLCPAFSAFHGLYNMHVFGKKPLNVVEGEPNMSKSKDALIALHASSDISQFYSVGTTIPGLRSIGEKFGLLQVLDDNSSLKKEEILAVANFEGAATRTKAGGAQKQLSTLLLTHNPGSEDRAARITTGRANVIRKEFDSYKEPPLGLLAINDRIGLTALIRSKKKPLDVFVKSSQLYFRMVQIPAELLSPDSGIECISTDGRTTSQYILWVAETAQMIREVTGRTWREVLSLACLFMWPRYFDELLPDDSEWHTQGGSERFYSEYLQPYISKHEDLFGAPKETNATALEQIFKEKFLPKIINVLAERGDEGPGGVLDFARLVKRDHTLLLWFRYPLPQNNSYRTTFKTTHDITSFKAVFARYGDGEKTFDETANVNGKTKRGWSILVSKLPYQLAADVCTQLGRRDARVLIQTTLQEIGAEVQVPNGEVPVKEVQVPAKEVQVPVKEVLTKTARKVPVKVLVKTPETEPQESTEEEMGTQKTAETSDEASGDMSTKKKEKKRRRRKRVKRDLTKGLSSGTTGDSTGASVDTSSVGAVVLGHTKRKSQR